MIDFVVALWSALSAPFPLTLVGLLLGGIIVAAIIESS